MRKILIDNSPKIDDEVSTLVDVLRSRSIEEPDRVAYTFLQDGETKSADITYKQLDMQARAIGAYLQSMKTQRERALLLYPPGLDFIAGFFGCLCAGVIAVPAYPPDPTRRSQVLNRLRAIVKDTKALLALTNSAILTTIESFFTEAPELRSINWIATDTIKDGMADVWEPPDIRSDTLAFLQYTSGSTSTPRGVMVSHDNILHNSAYYRYGWNHTRHTVSVTWLPTFHDLGLMDGVIQPLYTGFHSIIMPPLAFLQRPFRWVQAISQYKASYSAGPNFAYDLSAKKTTPEQRETLDLSNWQIALNAAEPVRYETMERFAKAFEPSGFRYTCFSPGYGLAEATLKVTTADRVKAPLICSVQAEMLATNRIVEVPAFEQGENSPIKRSKDVIPLVGCGTPGPGIFGVNVVIVNPDSGDRCEPNEIGEIWVSGPSIAQGYWNRPTETEQTFKAYLRNTNEGPFLRTGDLGFFFKEELFIAGRLKDLIIIDGLNYYPQDIELTIEKCHSLARPGCSAAFSLDIDGEERIVVVVEVNTTPHIEENLEQRQSKKQEIVKAIIKSVAEEHGLQIHSIALIKAGTIPKTSSGKIQRHACRASFLDKTLDLFE